LFRADSYENDEELCIFSAIQTACQSEDGELAHFVVNPNVVAILALIGRRSLTVNDISRSLMLPLATCYKLVEQMVELGLAARVGTTRTSSRGRAATYTSSVKAVNFNMSDVHVDLSITWKNGQIEHFKREFVPNLEPTGVELASAGSARILVQSR
jgi:hypothetical protein